MAFDGSEPVEMRPGSYLNIPAHLRHRVDWTDPDQPTVWLAIIMADKSRSEAGIRGNDTSSEMEYPAYHRDKANQNQDQHNGKHRRDRQDVAPWRAWPPPAYCDRNRRFSLPRIDLDPVAERLEKLEISRICLEGDIEQIAQNRDGAHGDVDQDIRHHPCCHRSRNFIVHKGN